MTQLLKKIREYQMKLKIKNLIDINYINIIFILMYIYFDKNI